MALPGKDTLYIEAEDEITAVIEKVVSSKSKIVAVVLPKHATVFQSQVNLKLLKKAAVSAKKNLVLITSDSSILAIAGVAGVHVAKTPTSKPVIPVAAALATTDTISLDEFTGTAPAESATKPAHDDDAIELDNTDGVADPENTIDEKKKKKLLNIPDFSSFRMRLTLGIFALVTLMILWFIGFVVLPKATITVTTDVSTNSVDTTITAKVGAVELDVANNIIPATKVQIEKIDSVTVLATGEKNVGTKATGSMTLTNCINDGEKKIIPAGTTFSSGSNSFLTAEAVTLKAAYFNDGACLSADFPILGAQGTVDVVAASAGESFNLSARAYNSSISGIQAYGSDMTGGTSQIIKVVSAEDVEKATQELSGTSKNQAVTELQKQLRDGSKRPIGETVSTGKANVVASPAIGAETKETKVTMTVTYGLLGVVESDLSQILDNQIKKNLKDQPINIRDNGLGAITFGLSGAPNDADTVLTLQTVATIGPDINPEQIKKDSAGKKRGDIEKRVESIEGVRSVSVEYSPFWVSTTPKNAEKITVVFVEENDN